jgi:hypothetical protein
VITKLPERGGHGPRWAAEPEIIIIIIIIIIRSCIDIFLEIHIHIIPFMKFAGKQKHDLKYPEGNVIDRSDKRMEESRRSVF